MLRRLFTLLLISMLPILAMGQNGTVYPIDLSVMMTPPYGTCLKEYVGSDRIVVQALLKDFSKKSEQFVVQLKVTDNRNRVVLLTNFGGYDFPAGKTFTYPMGPNADQGDKNNVLHQLFENAKIQPKNECFEEGAYTFEFQAFQAASYPSRKIALSMPFRYPVFLQGNTVQPLQIYPYENEVICSHAFEYTNENGIKRNAIQLGGIAYQWQSANPTGMRVGYLLQVVDLGLIGDKKWSDIKSEAGGIFGRVDKESYRVNELTYAPFYNHAFSAGNYEENHAYAWRVLALVGKDLELGKNASVNDNNAPVRVFYFCGAPGIEKDDYEVIKDDREFDKNLHKVKMDTVKSTDLNALALWRDSSVKDAYCGVNVEIRKKGQEKWTPYFVEQTNKYDESIDPTDNSYTFTNLSYNTRYEVRAQYVKCENCAQRPTGCVYAPYSDILEFVIAQPIDSATCGDDLPKLADCGDGVKAPRILAGDTIIANGTKVVVDSVSYPNASDSSIISGKGHICMPIVKNIQLKMEFEEITINCAKELVKGKIVSVWDDKTCAMIDIDELGGQNSTGGTDNTASDATVEEYDPSTANDKPAGTLMVDKDGTVKFKTKDGKIEDIGKSITLSAQEYQSKDFLSDNAHYIEFYNEDKNNAFDNNAQGYYDKISKYEYFDSPLNKVVLPWLANNPGKLKKIKAREVKKKETIASFESVMFVIPSGDSYIQLDAQQDKDGNYELQIPGWADVDYSTPIYAIARNSAESSYFDAGKMMQANYAERTHKLNIVSLVGELDASYKTEAEKALNSIYGKLGVSWTVELSKFDNDVIKNTILKDGLTIAADDENCWKNETKEMLAICRLYSEFNTIEKNSACLFVVNHAQEAHYKDAEGDMPRGQAVGYIFKDKVDLNKFGRLVAHEIGHGVYKLQHTFDYDGLKDRKKQTDNIMDYNTNNPNDFLAHYQWKVMQDSVMFVWGLLQNDEDGMLIDDLRLMLGKYVWIGDALSGFSSDNLEEKVNDLKTLLDHIYNKYDSYWDKLTSDNADSDVDGFSEWSIRKHSLKKTVCKSLYEKLSTNGSSSFNLHKKGIFLQSYIMNVNGSNKTYDVSVYSFEDEINIDCSKFKLQKLSDLADNKYVKTAYCEEYGIISLYGESGNLNMIVQVWSKDGDASEKTVINWLNYLDIVSKNDGSSIDSKESKAKIERQLKESDSSSWGLDKVGEKVDKLIEKLSEWSKNLLPEDKLPQVWEPKPKERYIVSVLDANKRNEDGTLIKGDIIPNGTEVEVIEFVSKTVNGKEKMCANVEIVGSNPKEVYLTAATNLTKIEVFDVPEKKELKRTIKSVELPFLTEEKTEHKESDEYFVLAKCGNYFRISKTKEVSLDNSKGYWVKRGAFQKSGDPIECLIDEKYFFQQRPGDCYNSCVDIVKNANGGVYKKSGRWALANVDKNGDEVLHMDCYADAIKALDASLENGAPVIVGVDWKKPTVPYNFDCITDHWVIIVGRGSDDEGLYYTYFEVAQTNEDTYEDGSKKGTSETENRFYITTEGYLQSKGKTINKKADRKAVVTVIEVNVTNCCCSRSSFEYGQTKGCDCESQGFYNYRNDNGKGVYSKDNAKGNLLKFR